jgi:hypothetical protein
VMATASIGSGQCPPRANTLSKRWPKTTPEHRRRRVGFP